MYNADDSLCSRQVMLCDVTLAWVLIIMTATGKVPNLAQTTLMLVLPWWAMTVSICICISKIINRTEYLCSFSINILEGSVQGSLGTNLNKLVCQESRNILLVIAVNIMASSCLFCQVGWWSRAPTSRSAARQTVRATEPQVSKFTVATATTATWPALPPVCHLLTACCCFCRLSIVAFSNRLSCYNTSLSPFSSINLRTEGLRLGCVDHLHYVGLKPQADVRFSEIYEVRDIRRLRCWNNRLASFLIWLCRGCCDFTCVSVSSNVSAKLVVQQMFLWLNIAPRVQPAGVTSLDTLTCHTSEEQCDYSEGSGKINK